MVVQSSMLQLDKLVHALIYFDHLAPCHTIGVNRAKRRQGNLPCNTLEQCQARLFMQFHYMKCEPVLGDLLLLYQIFIKTIFELSLNETIHAILEKFCV